SPLANLTTALPSLFQSGLLSAWLRGAAWLTAIAGTAAVGASLTARRAGRSSIAVTSGLAFGVLSLLAVAVGWRATDPEPVVAVQQGSTLLHAIEPGKQQVAVRFNPLRRLRATDVPQIVPIGAPAQQPSDPLLTVSHPPAGSYVIEAMLDGSVGR